MPGVWDVFSPDAFNLQSLTAAINKTAYVPGQISALGVFDEQGIPNLDALFEELVEIVDTLPVMPRGSSGTVVGVDKAKVRSLRIPHIPQRIVLMADSVQGVRQFGTENSAVTIESRRDAMLQKARRKIDYTMEAHRVEAIKGNYIDANNTTQSAYAFFEAGTQDVVNMALNVASTDIQGLCETIIGHVEEGLGGIPYTSIAIPCDRALWRALKDHAKVKEAFLNWQAAQDRVAGDVTKPFVWGGIEWHRYRGTSTVGMGEKTGYAIPLGVPDLFLTRFAPADYLDTVNTDGLPYYANMEPLPLNKGLHGEAQSNPLNICAIPQAICRVTTP